MDFYSLASVCVCVSVVIVVTVKKIRRKRPGAAPTLHRSVTMKWILKIQDRLFWTEFNSLSLELRLIFLKCGKERELTRNFTGINEKLVVTSYRYHSTKLYYCIFCLL